MTDYRRVFELLSREMTLFGNTICLAGRVTDLGVERWRTYKVDECIANVDRYSSALLGCGVRHGDRVALIGANCPEWLFADFAVQQIGAVTVPIFPSASDADVLSILQRTRSKICFVAGESLYARIQRLAGQLPLLESVYSLIASAGPASWPARVRSQRFIDGATVERTRDSVSENDVATIIFTSGTTGDPKGVVLTHRNIVSNVQAIAAAIPLPAGTRALSFLPLCHSFERLVSLGYMAFGVAVFLLDDPADLPHELRAVRPDYFTAVPRLLERQYEALLARAEKSSGLRRRLFDAVLALGRDYDETRPLAAWDRVLLWLANRSVFARWRAALGGRVRLILCGGARLDGSLARLLSAAKLRVIEGYGLTETSTFVTVNRLALSERRVGTVGRPLPSVELRIAKDGEILVRGPNVMLGYLDRPDLTAEAIDADAWFHTGDLGALDRDGFLTITGRMKDLFKLSTGEYVAPEALESRYRASRFIDQIMVVGEGRKHVAALIVPAFGALAEWYRERGSIPAGHAEMIADPAVRELIAAEMRALDGSVENFAQLRRFELLADEWTARDGELSPTLKLRRRIIAARHADRIERCYAREAVLPAAIGRSAHRAVAAT